MTSLKLFPAADEAETFELELSGLLTELQCPYKTLTQGDMTTRFGNKTNRLHLLGKLQMVWWYGMQCLRQKGRGELQKPGCNFCLSFGRL